MIRLYRSDIVGKWNTDKGVDDNRRGSHIGMNLQSTRNLTFSLRRLKINATTHSFAFSHSFASRSSPLLSSWQRGSGLFSPFWFPPTTSPFSPDYSTYLHLTLSPLRWHQTRSNSTDVYLRHIHACTIPT